MTQRYTDIYVFKDINVSSSGHYFAKVAYQDRGERVVRDYCLTSGFIARRKYNAGDWTGAPSYLEQEARRLIVENIRNGWFAYFEYDREGSKRYSNLRYYDADHVHVLAEQLAKDKTR